MNIAPLALAFLMVGTGVAADRRVTLIAGPPSHGPLAHEQNAAVLLLEKWLARVPGVKATAYKNGWPSDAAAIDNTDAIFIFCDGAERHLIFQEDRAAAVSKAMARGAGLMLYHFAVEPPAKQGHPQMLDWIGGFFELHYSVNPVWEADIRTLPKHPVTRGVRPFRLKDEWYFNMRFREPMRRVTPILTATPGAELVNRPDGPRSGNANLRSKAGQPQVLAWVLERPDGGRGAGFTGGHFHLNLGDPNFRKVVLNTLVWIAKAKVPANGVEVAVTEKELMEYLDPKPAR